MRLENQKIRRNFFDVSDDLVAVHLGQGLQVRPSNPVGEVDEVGPEPRVGNFSRQQRHVLGRRLDQDNAFQKSQPEMKTHLCKGLSTLMGTLS